VTKSLWSDFATSTIYENDLRQFILGPPDQGSD